MRHATGEKKRFPGRLVFWAENDALVILRYRQATLTLNRVLDPAHQPHCLHRTAQPGSGQIPPSGIGPHKRGHEDNRQREGNDRHRHPEKHQQ